MKAAELFVRALENEGVTKIFGVPGEENLDMVEALRASSIELVVTRHEQAAGFMAATWGRLTGRAGVCLSTLGPGATNLVTAAAYAQLGAMPMVMITGQKPTKSGKQGHFQIIDVVGMMKPLTKRTRAVIGAESIATCVRASFKAAEEERPGAVHIELPEDVAREQCEGAPLPRAAARRPAADEGSIAQAAAALRAARRPMVMIGAGANRKRTAQALRALIDRAGLPFATTQLGKGVVDEGHPLWMGCAALSSGDFLHRAIDEADCVLNVGHDVVEKPPFLQGNRTVIHLNFLPAEVDPVYAPQIEVVGDIANALWRLAEALSPQPTWQMAPFDRARAAMLDDLQREVADERFPVHPPRLVDEVRRALPPDGVVCLDNGLYKLWFARHFRCHMPNTLLLDNALATMGAGLPSAMAAKIVDPQKKVVAVCGDGGFMMNSQELETAVRLGLDLVILLLRDGGYGMIRWKQAEMGLPDHGMHFSNPDFVRYAEAYGAHGHRPEGAADLGPLLRRCLASPGVHLIDVPIDYTDGARLLGRELAGRAASL